MKAIPHDELAEDWNAFAAKHGLAGVRVPLVESFRLCLRKRWPEWVKEGDGTGWDVWERVKAGIEHWPFALGKESAKWTINLMYLLRNDRNWYEVMQRAGVGRGDGGVKDELADFFAGRE